VADREQELFLGHHKHYLEYEKTCREEEDEEERETMETWRHVVTKMDSSYLSAIQTVVAECFATGRISWIPWCGRYVQFAAAVLKVAVGEIPYIYSAMGKPVCVSDTAVANLTAYERILAISQPTLEPVEAEDLELAKRIEDVEAFVSGKLKIFPQCSSQVNTLRIRGDAVAETVHTVVKRQQFYQGKGACYLYLFPYRQRSAVFRKLGRFALLEDVVDQLRKRRVKLDDRHQMLWFNKQKHANVVKANNHSLERQVNYAVKVNPKAQIGGDDEEDATCCYCGMLSCQCGEEYPAGNGLRVGGDSDCWKALIFGEGEDMMLLSDLEKAWIEAWDTGDPEELERNLITTMIDYHIRDDGVMHVVDTMSVNSSTFEKLERRMKLYLEKGYKHLKEFFDEGRKVRLEERMVKGAGTCWMKLQPVAKIPGVSLSDPNTWAVKLTQVLDALRAVDGKVMAIFLKVTFDEVLDLHLEDVQMWPHRHILLCRLKGERCASEITWVVQPSSRSGKWTCTRNDWLVLVLVPPWTMLWLYYDRRTINNKLKVSCLVGSVNKRELWKTSVHGLYRNNHGIVPMTWACLGVFERSSRTDIRYMRTCAATVTRRL